jgi:hypothetical protein
MLHVPKTALRLTDGMVAYTSEFKGKKYVNIRKTYTDKATGEEGIGKGLTCTVEQWEAIEGMADEVMDTKHFGGPDE